MATKTFVFTIREEIKADTLEDAREKFAWKYAHDVAERATVEEITGNKK